MAGQRTKLILGDVKAEVSLVKTSGDSEGPRWDTVLLDVATGEPVIESTAEEDDGQVLIGAPAEPVEDGPPSLAQALEGTPAAPSKSAAERFADVMGGNRSMPVGVIPQNPQQALERDAAAGHVPATRQARGVYNIGSDDPDVQGRFIDLTQLLEDIDAHVKLDGLTVAKSIEATAIPRDRVRGSFYIEPAGKKAEKALAARVRDLLWTVLSENRRALVVRWTKRTNQALGIIVASKSHGALVLLEVEWGPNMRPASNAAKITPGFVPSADERAAAEDFLKRTAAPAATIETIADERRVLQIQAVTLARTDGKLLELPERHSDDEALAAALGA